MKNRGILILLTFFLAACGNSSQTKPEDSRPAGEYAKAISTQAGQMKDALLKSDFKAFIKYTYPKLVEMVGGEEKMMETIESSAKDMAAGGTTFSDVIIGEPSKVITAGAELQCTIPQTIEMRIAGGRLTAKSTLIGISSDGGKNWYFMDTSGKDITAMQKVLPNLSSGLVIPKMEEPVFTADK